MKQKITDVKKISSLEKIKKHDLNKLNMYSLMLSWNPKEDCSPAKRHYMEYLLLKYLISVFKTGTENPESKVKSCQLFYLNIHKVSDYTFKLTYLLLESRIYSGATDVETFWLVAALCKYNNLFKHNNLLKNKGHLIANKYIKYAPFAIDPVTAVLFLRSNYKFYNEYIPGWFFSVIDDWFQIPTQEELAVVFLEAALCIHYKSFTISDAVKKLNYIALPIPENIKKILKKLSDYYIFVGSEHVFAREIVYQAARSGIPNDSYITFLNEQIFNVSHYELYKRIRFYRLNEDLIDELYNDFVKSEKFNLARRLVESELVMRLSPWKYGKFTAQLKKAITKLVAGVDLLNPRIKLLSVRLVMLHAKTHLYTTEMNHLAEKIYTVPNYRIHENENKELIQELESYLYEFDPKRWLCEEQESIYEICDELTA